MAETPPNFETEKTNILSLDEFRDKYHYMFARLFLDGEKFSVMEDLRKIYMDRGGYDSENNPVHKKLESFHKFKIEQSELLQRARAATKKLHELLENRGRLPKETTSTEVREYLQTVLIPTVYEVYKILRNNYNFTDEDFFLKA